MIKPVKCAECEETPSEAKNDYQTSLIETGYPKTIFRITIGTFSLRVTITQWFVACWECEGSPHSVGASLFGAILRWNWRQWRSRRKPKGEVKP